MNDTKPRTDGRHQDETVDDRGKTLLDSGNDPFDGVAGEFADGCGRGESPSIGEYEARYPEHAERIRRLLPTVAMMEQLKQGSQQSRGKEPARPLPERLGEFRVLRELGRGGMGI